MLKSSKFQVARDSGGRRTAGIRGRQQRAEADAVGGRLPISRAECDRACEVERCRKRRRSRESGQDRPIARRLLCRQREGGPTGPVRRIRVPGRSPSIKTLPPAARSRTSSSSWETTSAGSTSAPITEASCPARRRTSTGWPRQGMLFTDYYAEASCTAGRANFITGELPIRTGLTTVGPGGRRRRPCRPRPARSPPRSRRRAMPRASSARTISAT